jgi:hypothetical protein
VNKHREVSFGTLFSLAELIGGVALAWYWLGFYPAIAIWPAGSLVAFILTLAMGGHVQGVWLLAQVILLLWGAWLLFQEARGSTDDARLMLTCVVGEFLRHSVRREGQHVIHHKPGEAEDDKAEQ